MPLCVATDAALKEVHRLARHALYHSDGLNRLARREYAHYSSKGIHPWLRAVLAGREYQSEQKKKK